MASIQKLANRQCWYASYRDAAGKQHLVSTRIEHSPAGATSEEVATNRRMAQFIANEWEDLERGSRTVTHLQRRYTAMVERVVQHEGGYSGLTVERYLNDWIEQKKPHVGEGYLGTLRQVFNRFLECLASRRSIPLTQLTPDDIVKFKNHLSESSLSASTVNHYLNGLYEAFKRAEKAGKVLVNPVRRDEFLKESPLTRKPLTADQVTLLLKATPRLDWRACILFGYYCGMRFADAAEQTWSNLNFDTSTVTWIPAKTSRTRRQVTLPLHPVLLEHLESMPRQETPEGWITPRLATYTPATRSVLFMRLLGRVGIDPEYVQLPSGKKFPRVSFHSLRHGYVTTLDEAGVSEDHRMLLAAHSTRRSHSIYVHTVVETLRRDIARLPSIVLPTWPGFANGSQPDDIMDPQLAADLEDSALSATEPDRNTTAVERS
jgi:integrase